jgi:hypothetical protein
MRELRNPQPIQASGDALGDTTLADSLRQQAERMQNEAKGLMAESDRLLKEAAALDPAPVTVVTETKTRKPKIKKVNVT